MHGSSSTGVKLGAGLNAFLDQERSYKIRILVQSQVPACIIRYKKILQEEEAAR